MSENDSSHRDEVNALFVQYSPRIRGFILSVLPNMSRADDVLQDTFMTVTAKADDFTSGSNFFAWACRIAHFKVLEEGKRDSKSNNILSPEVIEAICSAQPGADELREERLLALHDCLSKLAPHARRAIELRYSRAHRTGEIAQILGWSIE